MRHATWRWVGVIALALATGGCLGPSKPAYQIDHYVLEYDAPHIAHLEPLPAVVRMERFSVAAPYNTSRIVYRDSAYKRESYHYHRWRANPGDLVTHFLGRDFRESGLFRAVLPHDSRFSASCVLEGAVEAFYERDGKKAWDAVLGLNITLIADGEPDVSRRVLFQGAYSETEPCARKNPKALSKAMSLAMRRASERILADVYRILSEPRQGEAGEP